MMGVQNKWKMTGTVGKQTFNVEDNLSWQRQGKEGIKLFLSSDLFLKYSLKSAQLSIHLWFKLIALQKPGTATK